MPILLYYIIYFIKMMITLGPRLASVGFILGMCAAKVLSATLYSITQYSIAQIGHVYIKKY